MGISKDTWETCRLGEKVHKKISLSNLLMTL